MAQLVNHFPSKYKNPGSIPRIHIKYQWQWLMLEKNPNDSEIGGKDRQKLGSSPANQSSLLGKALMASEMKESIKQKVEKHLRGNT